MSIRVKDLVKTYGTQRALDGISFEIPKGQIVGFLGPNGAGKSTTMKILTCYLPQSSGIAEVCGIDVSVDPISVRRKIGYLPELNPLYGDMFIKEYLHFSASLHGLKKGVSARVEEMIALTGLTPERRKRIGQLSKGYKQRVGLAQALLHDPEVLVLDEPTSGLDPNQVLEIRKLITAVGQDRTVILSTHVMQEVEAMCNRVIIINKGRIVADDDTQTLRNSQQTRQVVEIELNETVQESDWKGISNVEVRSLGTQKWQLSSTEQDDLRVRVAAYAAEKGWLVLSMTKQEQRLEDIFHQLTKNN